MPCQAPHHLNRNEASFTKKTQTSSSPLISARRNGFSCSRGMEGNRTWTNFRLQLWVFSLPRAFLSRATRLAESAWDATSWKWTTQFDILPFYPANWEFGWTGLDCLNLLAFCLFNTKDEHEHLWGICLFQVLLDRPQSQFLFVPQELTAKLDWLKESPILKRRLITHRNNLPVSLSRLAQLAACLRFATSSPIKLCKQTSCIIGQFHNCVTEYKTDLNRMSSIKFQSNIL